MRFRNLANSGKYLNEEDPCQKTGGGIHFAKLNSISDLAKTAIVIVFTVALAGMATCDTG